MTTRITVDPTKGMEVLVAASRKHRPHVHKKQGCPFDPGSEEETPKTIMKMPGKNWRVRAFNNRFPAVKRHEIIVETSKHNALFTELNREQLELVWLAYIERYNDLARQKGAKCVCLFKNHGREGGASILHEHSQIIALPFVPRATIIEQEHFNWVKRKTGKCFYCQLAKSKKQKLFETTEYVAVLPEFGRFPKECWVVPKRHVRDFTQLNAVLLAAVQKALKITCPNDAPYDVVYHNPAKGSGDFHFHVEIISRSTTLAGLELGWNTYINQEDQREAVRELRRKLGKNANI